MAEKRMFALTIVDSDAFLDMGLGSQALYFALGMRSDDEGMVNNPRKIARMIGASEDDLRVLIAKRFIIPFDSGVIVIKHWKVNNYIQKDRFHPTVYQEERAMLQVKDNGVYTLTQQSVYNLDTNCIQTGYRLDTEYRVVKNSIDKSSSSSSTTTPTLSDIASYIANKNYSFTAERFFNYCNRKGWDNIENWQEYADSWQSIEKSNTQRNRISDINERTYSKGAIEADLNDPTAI